MRTMNKKIKEKLDSWDLKSLFLTIAILSIGLFLFFYLTDIRDRLRTADKERYTGQIDGTILTVEKVDRMSQSKWKGTRIYVDSYKVKYQFQFQGQTYESIDMIPLTIKNQKLLTKILDQNNKAVLVKFDTADPNKSLLTDDE
jgi:hypothetical protein